MKTTKRIFAAVIAMIMLLSSSVVAYADDAMLDDNPDNSYDSEEIQVRISKGTFGENFTYSYDVLTGVLEIDGNGFAGDESYYSDLSEGTRSDYPWLESGSKYNKVIFGDGITGADFEFFITKTISLGASFCFDKPAEYYYSDSYSAAAIDMYGHSVEKYEVSKDNTELKAIDGVLYSKDMTKLIKYPFKKNADVFTVPSGVKTVCSYAFGWNDDGEPKGPQIKKILFPKSVTHIYANAIKDAECVFVLNPKCKIDIIGVDGADYNFYFDCLIYKAGVKKYKSMYNSESTNPCAPLYYKNSKYFAVSTNRLAYNGKARKPKVYVLNKNGKILKNKKDYSVKYSKGRKKVGKISVTIKNKKGTKKLHSQSFSVVPTEVKLTSVKKKGKKLIVKWKKHTTQTTGFEIKYKVDSKNAKTKKLTIKKNKTTSKTIKGINSKKVYWVYIRAYKTVKGKKYYSDWYDYITD